MKRTKDRPGVMLYFHNGQALSGLSDPQFGRLIRALLEYAQYEVIPCFDDPILTALWPFLRHASDVDRERYEQRCAQARSAVNKRWGKDAAEYEPISTIPKEETEPEAQAERKTDADAQTTAPAPADNQTEPSSKPASDPEPEAEPDTIRITAGPSQNMSPAWGRMMNALYRLEQDKAKAAKQVADQQLLDAVRRKRQQEGLAG